MIDNRTAWSATTLGVSDRRGEPALCVVVEATLHIDGKPCDGQPAICLDGAWDGEPATTSPREAPCATHPKSGTDCLLRGHGCSSEIRFHCGPVATSAELRGPRQWVRHWYGIRPGSEGAFEPVPLTWEHAAGPVPANPVGTGLVTRREPFRDGIAMPCLERHGQPLRRWGRAVMPVGFGPTTPAWAHRRDLDPYEPALQQVAPPELIAPCLRGDEPFSVSGCRQPMSGHLPGLPPPLVRISRRQGDLRPDARLDTVLFDADALTIRLTWRAWCPIGEHTWVDAVEIS